MSAPRRVTPLAVIGAVGIVYGDIGTSPLYAFEMAIRASGSSGEPAVLGILSLIFWSLALSVTLKYIVVMMRADNQGEGGVLALLALGQERLKAVGRMGPLLIGCALAGTALFFCDGMITPAITVMSAVEGLELIKPDLSHAVIPVTLIVVAGLFALQQRGTAQVAKLFGPVMVVWFLCLAVSGIASILNAPHVLIAINPAYGVELLVSHPGMALVILGAVFLALTGGEALYADMGHFGKTPVRIAWFVLVWPSLLFNYFGQGALYLNAGHELPRPLYTMVPPELLPYMVILATAASVIASQAVISGAFSVARQAVQLDLLPRLRVLQTSALEQGQIYVPIVNGLLFIAVVAFVVGFGSSDALSAAYGSAVIGTMAMTSVLGAFVALTLWGWPKPVVVLLFGVLLLLDFTFLAGNLTKIDDGGWIPLALAAVLFGVFTTWRAGRTLLRRALAEMAVPRLQIGQLLEGVPRVAGTGVFLASDPDFVPSALIRNLEHNHVAHQRIVVLNIDIARTPRRDPAHRVSVEEIEPHVFGITAHFGFMETPDVGEALRCSRARGLRIFMEDCSFFVGQHVVRPRPLPGWRGLQRRLFARMQKRSTQAAEFFRMPSRGLVILTTVVDLMLVSLVVAMDEEGVIGRGNALPWHLPDDLRRFKALTMGKPILMGRKTFESIGKPLPGRLNLVLTRSRDWQREGVMVVHSIEEAIQRAADADELAVIGGEEIFRLTLSLARRIYLTEVHARVGGDTRFPALDRKRWRETERSRHPADERHTYAMTFLTLER